MPPSTMFYDDTLEPFASSSVQTTPLANWDRLPRPGFPVLFYGCESPEDFVDEGASWFNEAEERIVVDAVGSCVVRVVGFGADESWAGLGGRSRV
jgi:hypothetical protein